MLLEIGPSFLLKYLEKTGVTLDQEGKRKHMETGSAFGFSPNSGGGSVFSPLAGV